MVEANPTATTKNPAQEEADLSAPSTSAAQATQEDPEESKGSPRPQRRQRGRDDQQAAAAGGGVSATRDDELIINTSEQIEIVTSFDQLGIPEQLLRGK